MSVSSFAFIEEGDCTNVFIQQFSRMVRIFRRHLYKYKTTYTWRSSPCLISPLVDMRVPRVQLVYMYITYLSHSTTMLELGLSQQHRECLYTLVTITVGVNYLDFTIGCMRYYFRKGFLTAWVTVNWLLRNWTDIFSTILSARYFR